MALAAALFQESAAAPSLFPCGRLVKKGKWTHFPRPDPDAPEAAGRPYFFILTAISKKRKGRLHEHRLFRRHRHQRHLCRHHRQN
jgi:hypothetical protein